MNPVWRVASSHHLMSKTAGRAISCIFNLHRPLLSPGLMENNESTGGARSDILLGVHFKDKTLARTNLTSRTRRGRDGIGRLRIPLVL